jgi:hypothetical protein
VKTIEIFKNPPKAPSAIPKPTAPAPSSDLVVTNPGEIKKGSSNYEAMLQNAKRATDNGLGELMFKNGTAAKQYIQEALTYIKQLQY